ncbi:EAL domain-containing protein [Paraliobacillus sp. X-1268]|uniref:EAL domain-containing protein n=1 Tax=Paraliobacillus sp. X-1268 TaxID=2213193 RepID=UPI000E3B6D6B|nr:EAL domain-containing protein [Paraliobacillus sp. X-1268]
MKKENLKFSSIITRLFSNESTNEHSKDDDIVNKQNHAMLMKKFELTQKHLIHAQEIAKVGSWEYIIDEDKLYCSDYFYDIFGLDHSQYIPMTEPFQYVHPDDFDEALAKVKKAIKGKNYYSEYRIYHGKTNELRYLKTQAEVSFINKKPYKLIGMIQDITDEKNLEQELITINNRFKQIFDHLSSGIWMKDYPSNKLSFISKGAEEIFNLSLDDIYADETIWHTIIHPNDREQVFNRQKELLAGKSIKHRYRIITHDGETKWVFDQTIPSFNSDNKLIALFGVIVDITSEMVMHEELVYYASHDVLTNLPNQRSISEKIAELIQKKKQFTLFYLDLDRLSHINDSLGYQIGNKVLQNIASKLTKTLSSTSYVARLVSNDFIIIDTETLQIDTASNLADKLLRTIEEEINIFDYQLNITTSVGISFYPDNGDTELKILESSHIALKEAKNNGGNTYKFYSPSNNISSFKKYMLERDLRKAITNEEFEVYYQPQVNAFTGLIESAEALLRWNHKEWGLVSPSEFIPLAEENYLMNDIGDWVITKVIEQLKIWKDQDYILRPISINISPNRFLKPGLISFIKEQLEKYDISAHFLTFEITESTYLKNENKVQHTLSQLRALGISIAIDDFGTGYASLQYLRDFPADELKIDRVFILNILDDNKKDAAIVSSILYLAKSLDMRVIVEGVENFEQLQFLKQKECHLIQGYLFSEAVPSNRFEELIKKSFLPIPKSTKVTKPKVERRKYYRLSFPGYLQGGLSILEINNRKVDVGTANILIENISLGGLKLMSDLKLPVQSNMKIVYTFSLLGFDFEIIGSFVWKSEIGQDIFYYGVAFDDFSEANKDHLAKVINQLTIYSKNNKPIPDTDFYTDNPITYFFKNID